MTVYTVTYNGNGNTSGVAPVDSGGPYASGAFATILGPGTLGKAAADFAAWNASPDGSGTFYAQAPWLITASLVLYAIWMPAIVTPLVPGLPILSRKNATQFSLSLITNTQTFSSPLNKTEQTYELPGARWQWTATWENLKEVDARIMKAWILKLRGAAGRFAAGDLSHKRPAGWAIGSGTVHGADQNGRSLVTQWAIPVFTADSTIITADDTTTLTIDGAVDPIPGWLLPGDYFSVNGELKMITDEITLNGTGLATLIFEPPLRSAPADSSPVIISQPTATFRLNDDQQDKFPWNPDRHPSITIAAMEVF